MINDKFRRQLRQESEKWWREGWIDASIYQRLSEHYQFDGIEATAKNRFVMILLALGGILLGLGVITFVAANWQGWPREFRVFLLLTLFIAINSAGFYLWRKPLSTPGLQRLGHGLLLTGALVLGANLALMSQMFHQSGEVFELFFVWGLGVGAMAYSLRLVSLGVLAWILWACAFWGWWFTASWWGGSGFIPENTTWINQAMEYMALLSSLIFIPLAYWCRSRVIFGLGAIAFAVCYVFDTRPFFTPWNGLLAIALTLPPALLWAYDLKAWKFQPVGIRPQNAMASSAALIESTDPFQAIARSLAVWFFSIMFYVFSFHWFWESYGYGSSSDPSLRDWQWQTWRYGDNLLFLILALLGWARISTQLKDLKILQKRSINSGAIALFIVISALLFFWHPRIEPLPVLAPFLINVLLFLLAIGLIRDGLALGSRRTFWGGMILLILGIISRMVEYNTGLLFKSLIFFLCGVGVIVAGLYFERNLKPSQSPNSAQRPAK